MAAGCPHRPAESLTKSAIPSATGYDARKSSLRDGAKGVKSDVPPTPCKAFPDRPHPATRRSGYCDKHHDEYERAMLRYRNAVYNYRHGRTPTRPPTKTAFIRSIKFSDLDTMWTYIEGTDREAMLRALADLNRDTLFLTELGTSPESFYEMNPTEWRDNIAKMQLTMQRVTALLTGLIRKQPPSSTAR